MRKFLAALIAVFMLTAALAVLPASATTAPASTKDGSTAADADAIDLVITEVLADTKSNVVSMSSKNAFQYIEIYNRGTETVDLYDYAIVRGEYNERSADSWPSKKFDKKILLDSGSIYGYYADNSVPNINLYNTSVLQLSNPNDGTLAPGQTALIWIWNQDTKDVFGANGGTTTAEKQGDFTSFKNHYADMGAAIPAGTKIIAAFGVDGIGQSFHLNTSKSYMYALVNDQGEGFDVSAEKAYEVSVGGAFTRNDKIETMWKFGTALGYTTTVELKSVIYTLANKTPSYTNAYLDKNDVNYYAAGKVDSYKEMACIYFEETVTPGKLLPIQWADLDPAKAPADVKGSDANWATTAWNTYVNALVLANGGGATTDREEDDLGQGDVNVDRDDLGNQGQNKAGEWTFFIGEDGKYYRYKTEGGSKDTAVEITKEEYDIAMAALAQQDSEDEGLGIWLWVIIGGAALVVLGAGAAVLIIVLKKKNKNVATDDVAGFVQIIDENGMVDPIAPVNPEDKQE